MIKENSQSICDWGDSVFGKADTLKAYAIRAQEELRELIEAIDASETEEEIVGEAADVTILLHRLVGTIGLDLYSAVDNKMTINRQRQWGKDGNGTGRHIKG